MGGNKLHRNTRTFGFTLVEVLSALVLVAVLIALSSLVYRGVRNSGKVAEATQSIVELQIEIDEYALSNGTLPADLTAIGKAGLLDPWGNSYRYLIVGKGTPGLRRDRFLVPLNSTYDLYSAGRDGLSAPQISRPQSLDDVIRANDGAYVGLASGY